MIKTLNTFEKAPVLMRDAYVGAMLKAAEANEGVVALDADLSSAFGMSPFFKAYPERAIQCGIAEANMVGIAAGLSAVGKIPFAHSFGCFTSRRACDQIMISCAYAKLNVRLIGSDPGVTAAHNGGTHMPFEDMGVLRSVPGITLMDVTDPVMLTQLVAQLAGDELYGVYYLRFPRKSVTGVYQEGSTFEIGKGITLRDGRDVTIIASGIMVPEALIAAAELEKEGTAARVVDMFTWKPIDAGLIADCARETGAIVTAENHNITGGLFAAVAEVTARALPVPIEPVGIEDSFGQVGSEDYLKRAYSLTAEKIAAAARTAIAKKAKQ
ncbi:MAG: transketolase family protein [Oscillospiraceae bacterium]|jgi:transketolase|nr:transketolase family protein [Oscillospiraceae bacterium]